VKSSGYNSHQTMVFNSKQQSPLQSIKSNSNRKNNIDYIENGSSPS